MELTLTEQDLLSLAKRVAPLISPTKHEPDWVKLEDIRADLFAGKAKSWIRLFIFDRFPEIQIDPSIFEMPTVLFPWQTARQCQLPEESECPQIPYCNG